MEDYICPACINEYNGELGSEKEDYPISKKWLCEAHSHLNLFQEMQKAEIKLGLRQ